MVLVQIVCPVRERQHPRPAHVQHSAYGIIPKLSEHECFIVMMCPSPCEDVHSSMYREIISPKNNVIDRRVAAASGHRCYHLSVHVTHVPRIHDERVVLVQIIMRVSRRSGHAPLTRDVYIPCWRFKTLLRFAPEPAQGRCSAWRGRLAPGTAVPCSTPPAIR